MLCINTITAMHFGVFVLFFGMAVLLVSNGLKDHVRRYVFVVACLAAIGSLNKVLLQNPCIKPEDAIMFHRYTGFVWRGISVFALVVALNFSGFLSKKKMMTVEVFAIAYFILFSVSDATGRVTSLVQESFGFRPEFTKTVWGFMASKCDDFFDACTVLVLAAGTFTARNALKKRQGIFFLIGTVLSFVFVYSTRGINYSIWSSSANVQMLPALVFMVAAMKLFGFIENTPAAAASYIFNASLEMMVILGPGRKVTEANYAFKAIAPGVFSVNPHPDFADLVGAPEAVLITETLEKYGMIKGHEIVFDLNEKNFHGLVSGFVMKRAGVTSGYAIVITDITQLKNAESELLSYRDHLEDMITARTEELNAANANLKIRVKTSEDFIRASHHDLLEPIRAISKMLQLVLKKASGTLDESMVNMLRESSDSASVMESLIYDIREYTLIEGGSDTHKLFNIKEAAQQAVTEMAGAVSTTAAVINANVDMKVRGNQAQIKKLFSELISNSIKFRSGSVLHIDISAQKSENKVIISFRDNGIGIPDEYKERVFSAFERLHPRDRYKGNGIGLAICSKIMELHGGRIWAEKGTETGTIIKFEMGSV